MLRFVGNIFLLIPRLLRWEIRTARQFPFAAKVFLGIYGVTVIGLLISLSSRK